MNNTINQQQNNAVIKSNFKFVRENILKCSIEECAETLNVSKSTYQRFEDKNNNQYSIKTEYIIALCDKCKLSMDDFCRVDLSRQYSSNIEREKSNRLKNKLIIISYSALLLVLLAATVLLFFKWRNAEAVNASEIQKIYYWSDNGECYHVSKNCFALRATVKFNEGTLDQAEDNGLRECSYCSFFWNEVNSIFKANY